MLKKLVLLLLLTGCGRQFYPENHFQAILLEVKYERHNKAELTMLRKGGDTVYCKYGWDGIGRKRFVIGEKYTVMYSFSVNNKTYYRSIVRRNE